MPKADRVKKFRNDSVDEIDTSDMEAYLTGQPKKRHPLTQKQAAHIIASEISKGKMDISMLRDPEMKGAFDF